MDWPETLKHAAQNREDGAQTIAMKVLQELASTDSKDLNKDELRQALQALREGQPSMAPILRVYSELNAALEESLEAFSQKSRELYQAFHSIEANFCEKLKYQYPDVPDDHPWVFYSWSSTINLGLEILGLDHQEPDLAWVGESIPGGEGQKTAELLAELGVDVKLLPDSFLFDRVGRGEAGIVILGCDGLDDERFVNKVGSGALAQLAHDAGTPVELWTTSMKLLPPGGVDRLDLSPRDTSQSENRPESVATDRPLFGTGLLAHVTGVRTEEGLIEPSDIAVWSYKLVSGH
jgi:translation initiation factor 2B subunit (eIF-2B alpha/beta/delta family)